MVTPLPMQISLHDQPLHLLPGGAVLLSTQRVLVVADVHLGKSATFRARGLPVPEGDNEHDLSRLRSLVSRHAATRLVIAGDLFHAPAGVSPELKRSIAAFLNAISIPTTLVMGNHDAKLLRIPNNLPTVPHLDLEQIRIVHDPRDASPDHFNLAGHLHPVIRIADGKRTALRLPCFLHRHRTLILPAFGSFTGGVIMKRESGDQVFVAHRDRVIELPASLCC